jgi:hypothetical protein
MTTCENTDNEHEDKGGNDYEMVGSSNDEYDINDGGGDDDDRGVFMGNSSRYSIIASIIERIKLGFEICVILIRQTIYILSRPLYGV